MKKTVIIVAGGVGKRMKNEIPKQFLLLGGKPLLMHTVKRFYEYSSEIEIVIVLPANQAELWENLCGVHQFSCEHKVVAGGITRFDSVKNGLQKAEKEGLIAVHDGVRPFVSIDTITRVFNEAEKTGNAVPCMIMNETARMIDDDKSFTVNREKIRIIQTPQVFRADILIHAYETAKRNDFTDDASVVESSGIKINLTEGNKENIKITDPSDMKIAELILKNFI